MRRRQAALAKRNERCDVVRLVNGKDSGDYRSEERKAQEEERNPEQARGSRRNALGSFMRLDLFVHRLPTFLDRTGSIVDFDSIGLPALDEFSRCAPSPLGSGKSFVLCGFFRIAVLLIGHRQIMVVRPTMGFVAHGLLP